MGSYWRYGQKRPAGDTKMANFTKKAIQESFLKLLTERPLSKITVKDIVADCGINRNTFYYYFEDMPKLIESIVEDDAEKIIQSYPTIEKLEDCLDAAVELALTKKRAVLHIYHSANREIYEMYLWKICDHTINAYVASVLRGKSVRDSDLAIVKEYLSSLAFGIFSRWLKNDMDDDIRSMLSHLTDIKKGMIEEMILCCVKE